MMRLSLSCVHLTGGHPKQSYVILEENIYTLFKLNKLNILLLSFCCVCTGILQLKQKLRVWWRCIWRATLACMRLTNQAFKPKILWNHHMHHYLKLWNILWRNHSYNCNCKSIDSHQTKGNTTIQLPETSLSIYVSNRILENMHLQNFGDLYIAPFMITIDLFFYSILLFLILSCAYRI